MVLFRLVKSLSKEEIKLISKVFKQKQGSIKGASASQEGELFFLILNSRNEELSEAFLKKALKLSASRQAFFKLCSRVLNSVLDVMSSEDFILNENILDGADKAEVRIKKKLLQAKILYTKTSKSDPEVFLHILNEIIIESKEFELYDNLIEALSYRKYYQGNRLGYKEYLAIKEEIDFYKACAAAKSEANDYYCELISNQKLISYYSANSLEKILEEKINILANSPFTKVSSRIQYFYKILQLAFFQDKQRYREAIKVCYDILELLQKSKAIRRTERYGAVYVNLSNCLIYKRSFQEAAHAARTSQIYFPHNSLSFVLAKEQEFFACLYAKNIKRCREVLDMMKTQNKKDSGSIRHDIFKYYQACMEFADGNFKEARAICNFSFTIQKDKTRWDLGIRYLKIMSQVELGEYEEARDSIEALRKQIKRNKEKDKTEIGGRDLIIFNALHNFAMTEFKEPSTSLLTELKKLELNEGEFAWRFFTHEIVPVHEWLTSRFTKYEKRRRTLA